MFSVPALLSLLSYLRLLPSDWSQPQIHLAPVQQKSIAIIGAGSAGLAALKTAIDISEQDNLNWNIVLFEEREDVGGIWLPDSRMLPPPNIPETPLYPRLRTNTPVPAMTYPHFVFPSGTHLYPSHERILEYHRAYAGSFRLRSYIRFNHSVLTAEWRASESPNLQNAKTECRKSGNDRGRWNVTFNVRGDGGDDAVAGRPGGVRSEFFDHLVVASGNHHIPKLVHWRGEDEWLAYGRQRHITHAIWYRDPEIYIGKRVVIVGAGASGKDIANQIAGFAEKVYVSVRHPVDPIPGAGLCAEISHFTKDRIHLVDGTTLRDVDSVILGTGYQIRKPFLETGGLVKSSPHANSSTFRSPEYLTTNANYLFPLHKHIFPILRDLPVTALAFVGMPMGIANCPSDIAQGLYVLHLMKAGDGVLPSKEEMLRELDRQEDDVWKNGFDPYVLGHRLVRGTQSDYQDDLVEFLKEKGLIRDDRRRYVESWRRDVLGYDYLRRGWFRIEELGLAERWLQGVETEEQWARLMARINEWEKDWESRNNITFTIDEFLV